MDGVKLVGEKDVMGSSWNSALMGAGAGARNAWKSGGVFNSATWIGDQGLAVNASTWSGSSFRTWSGRRWTGDIWSGRRWRWSSRSLAARRAWASRRVGASASSA